MGNWGINNEWAPGWEPTDLWNVVLEVISGVFPEPLFLDAVNSLGPERRLTGHSGRLYEFDIRMEDDEVRVRLQINYFYCVEQLWGQAYRKAMELNEGLAFYGSLADPGCLDELERYLRGIKEQMDGILDVKGRLKTGHGWALQNRPVDMV